MRAAALVVLALVDAFTPPQRAVAPSIILHGSKVGVYYGTEGQNTEAAADMLVELLNAKFDGIAGETSFPVDEIDGVEDLMDHELLLVGCPTWNTGADTERSGTDWDDLYYEDDGLPSLDFAGKKVAVFGCGDSGGYADNFCDAMDELASCFKAQGAEIIGAVPTDDYEFIESKSVVDGKFVGLATDEDQEPDKSEDRVNAWIDQIKGEGMPL